MGWYRVHKTFRGGQYPSKGELTEYIEVPRGTLLNDVKEYAESWADRTPGGHNYGYRVYWKRVSRPSRTWLNRECSKACESIKRSQNYIKDLGLILNQ